MTTLQIAWEKHEVRIRRGANVFYAEGFMNDAIEFAKNGEVDKAVHANEVCSSMIGNALFWDQVLYSLHQVTVK